MEKDTPAFTETAVPQECPTSARITDNRLATSGLSTKATVVCVKLSVKNSTSRAVSGLLAPTVVRLRAACGSVFSRRAQL